MTTAAPGEGGATRAPHVRRPRLHALGGGFVVVIALLSTAAWVGLIAWRQSPFGRYLDHGDWTAPGLLADWCAAVPGGTWAVPAAFYAGGWLLMIAAMMVPTTLPLLTRFRRMTAARSDARLLLALVVTGYVAAWLAFGVAAHAADRALLRVVQASDWLRAHAWVVGTGVVACAGLFQFSTLKYRCLDRCRTPMGFIVSHWRGRRDRWQAFRLGVDHGAFCVGCCWALMLLMFVVGTGSLGWMLALGAVMALEKNAPWGRHLSAPLGLALIALAAWQAKGHLFA